MDDRSRVRYRRQVACIPGWNVVLLVAAAIIVSGTGLLPSVLGQQPESRPFNAQVDLQDWPQLGGSPSRNNAVETLSLPTEWDMATGKNIRWSVPLGSETYGNVVVANGRVFVGTNNGASWLKKYPATVDLGVLLCFSESDGRFLWQYSSEKLATGRVHDWPNQGICSSPVVEGDRMWFVTNRGEVVCLDTQGYLDNEDDGSVEGLRKPLFEVPVNLNQILNESSDFGTTGSRGWVAVRMIIKAFVPELTGKYVFKPKANESAEWFAETWEVRRRLFELSVDPDSLIITGLKGQESQVRVDADLTAGLNEGRISSGIRLLLKSQGIELPDLITSRVQTMNHSWTIESDSTESDAENSVFPLILRRVDSLLVCEQQLDKPSIDEADVVWSFNMMHELGVRQHNMATCAPTIWGDVVYVCTSNGVDETHVRIPAPEAPSFLALDKHTGQVLWTDNSPGENILHGQWSCPLVGVFDGIPQVIFPGGDGWLYTFRADRWSDGKPELLWKFDGNPKESLFTIGGRATRNGIIAVPVIYDGLVYLAMGEDPEYGEGEGHLWCIDPTRRGDVSPELVLTPDGKPVPHRRTQVWIRWEPVFQFTLTQDIQESLEQQQVTFLLRDQFRKAGASLSQQATVFTVTKGKEWRIRNTDRGQIREYRLSRINALQDKAAAIQVSANGSEHLVPNPNSAVVWHYSGQDLNADGKIEFEETMHRSLGSPAISRDLLLITDFSGLVHCLNAKSGRCHWTCDLMAACWTTPLIAGENVYVGDEDGTVTILALSADPARSLQTMPGVGMRLNEPLRTVNMDTSIYTMPVTANDVLYIASRNRLFAIRNTSDGKLVPR
jgi:outer membrane protein assembly factor BamB